MEDTALSNTGKNVCSPETSCWGWAEGDNKQRTWMHLLFGLTLVKMTWLCSKKCQLRWFNWGLEDPLYRRLTHKENLVLEDLVLPTWNVLLRLSELPHSMVSESNISIPKEQGESVWDFYDLAQSFYYWVSPLPSHNMLRFQRREYRPWWWKKHPRKDIGLSAYGIEYIVSTIFGRSQLYLKKICSFDSLSLQI